MRDPFFLMELESRPYLDPQLIDERFRKLAARLHPDQKDGDTLAFQELHAATTILRSPEKRLRLLTKSSSEKKRTFFSSETGALFSAISEALSKADALAKKYQETHSGLAKAVLLGLLKKEFAELSTLSTSVKKWRNELEKKLLSLDAAWPAISSDEMLSLADEFTFCSRWEAQLKERLLTMMLLLG